MGSSDFESYFFSTVTVLDNTNSKTKLDAVLHNKASFTLLSFLPQNTVFFASKYILTTASFSKMISYCMSKRTRY